MTGIVFAVVVFCWLTGLLIYAAGSRRRILTLEDRVVAVSQALELHKSKARAEVAQLEKILEDGVRGLVIKEIRQLLHRR